jgi:SH3-like domain-containing protein
MSELREGIRNSNEIMPKQRSRETRARIETILLSLFVVGMPGIAGLPGPARASELGAATGLPIPRFVSIKSEPANVRVGPGFDYPIKWTFVRRHLPVEVVAEFGNWRRIRDAGGEDGWILGALLSGRRMALVAPWSGAQPVLLRNQSRSSASINAIMQPRVLVRVDACGGTWCRVRAGSASGYVRQSKLWGAYPGEIF